MSATGASAPRSRGGGALRGLALSCHPIPTLGVTALSAGLAALAGLGFGRGLLFTGAVFVGQLSIGWSNDWIDAARDRAVARSDKPVAAGSVPPRTVSLAAAVALVVAVGLSLALGVVAGLVTLILVASGWAYNAGLKSTWASGVPYATGFGSLPAGAVLAASARWPAWWAMAAGALLGLAAHAANVLPDLRADKATGVAGLWHRSGARTTAVAGPVLLWAASLLVLFGPAASTSGLVVGDWKWWAAGAVGVLAAAGVVTGLRAPDSRVFFLATIALAGIDLLFFAVSGTSLRG